MKAIIKNQNKIIVDRVKIADNPISRTIGLLNKKNLGKGEGLLLKPCNGVHSFFMRFNFDAIYLNKDNSIIFLEENIKPNRILPILKNAKTVLELPANTISEFNIQVFDELEFIE